MQATTSVYDALAELPPTSLSYANVLKPLINLDFVKLTKNSWMNVSEPNKYNKSFLNYLRFVVVQWLSNVALDASLRETARDITKNWAEVLTALSSM